MNSLNKKINMKTYTPQEVVDLLERDRALSDIMRIVKDIEDFAEWHDCITESDGLRLEDAIDLINKVHISITEN